MSFKERKMFTIVKIMLIFNSVCTNYSTNLFSDGTENKAHYGYKWKTSQNTLINKHDSSRYIAGAWNFLTFPQKKVKIETLLVSLRIRKVVQCNEKGFNTVKYIFSLVMCSVFSIKFVREFMLSLSFSLEK